MSQAKDDKNELTLKEKIMDAAIKTVQMLVLSYLLGGLFFNWLGPIIWERWTKFNFWILFGILEVGVLMGFNKTRTEREKSKKQSEKLVEKLLLKNKKEEEKG